MRLKTPRRRSTGATLVAFAACLACKIEARHELDVEDAPHAHHFVDPPPVIPERAGGIDSSSVAGVHRSALALELVATRPPVDDVELWLESLALERAQERLLAVGASPWGEAGGWWVAGVEDVEVHEVVSGSFSFHWREVDMAFPPGALELLAAPAAWQGPIEAVHVGGGVTEPEQGIDDYAGLDVGGHLVVIDQAESADGAGRDRPLEYLAQRALAAGATGCILLADGSADRGDPIELELAGGHGPLVAVVRGPFATRLRERGLARGDVLRVSGKVVSRREERQYRHLVARLAGLEHPEQAMLLVVLPPRRLDREGARRYGRALAMLSGVAGQWKRSEGGRHHHSLVLLALDPVRGDRTNLGELLSELRLPPESLVGVVTIDGVGITVGQASELVAAGDGRVWERAARRFAPGLSVTPGPGPARRANETLEGLRALGIPTVSLSVPGSDLSAPTQEAAVLSSVGYALETILDELDRAPLEPAPEPGAAGPSSGPRDPSGPD